MENINLKCASLIWDLFQRVSNVIYCQQIHDKINDTRVHLKSDFIESLTILSMLFLKPQASEVKWFLDSMNLNIDVALTLLLLPGSLVTCRNIHDTVGIDVECYLNLRHTSWCRWNTDLKRERHQWWKQKLGQEYGLRKIKDRLR